MLKGMTLKKRKNRPNDPHVPWPASKHSVVRFSNHQVILPQHTKVRMLGRASEAAENPPTVQGENDDLAKHTKNTGNFQFTSMEPILGGEETSRFVPVLFSGPSCP